MTPFSCFVWFHQRQEKNKVARLPTGLTTTQKNKLKRELRRFEDLLGRLSKPIDREIEHMLRLVQQDEQGQKKWASGQPPSSA